MKNNTIYERLAKQIGILEKDLKYIYVNEKTKNKTEQELETLNKIYNKINNSNLPSKYKQIIKEKLNFASNYGNITIKSAIRATIKFDNNMEYLLKITLNENIELLSIYKCKDEIISTSLNAMTKEDGNYINYEEKHITKKDLKNIKKINLFSLFDKKNNQIFGNYIKEELAYRPKNKGILEKEEITIFKEDETIYKKKSRGRKNIDIKNYNKDSFIYDNNSFFMIENGKEEKICKKSYIDAINTIKSKHKKTRT